MDPEQQMVLDDWFGVDAQERLVAPEVGAAAPRQNIKSHVGKAATLGDLYLFNEPECLWTAHLRQTSDDAFRNQYGTGLADLFESYDWLRRRVKQIKDSDGEKFIELMPRVAGGPRPRCSFVSRGTGSGRGLSGRRVTFDEALFLKPNMLAAMIPILSAQSMSGQVQVRYLGSPGLLTSAAWREIRDRGRAGVDGLAWVEWAAEREPCEDERCTHVVGSQGCALDREHLVRQANLAVDRRIHIKFVMVTERGGMPPADYMRERLGWWDDPPAGGGVLDLERWDALAVGNVAMNLPTLSVEVALDRSSATIGAAWVHQGRRHVEVVEARPGTGWVVARIAELTDRYAAPVTVIDMDTEARGLAAPLEAEGVTVLPVQLAERAIACGAFHDAALAPLEEALTHNGDPAISTAIGAARWKDVGDGRRVFSRRASTADIAPLYAVTLALHGLALELDYDVEDSVR
jgi:hypothetical protein